MRIFALLVASVLFAADPPSITLYRIAAGFDMPTMIRFSPDGSGRMFVVEQRGYIRIIKNGSKIDRPFLDWRTKVSCCDERGLLGLAFSPAFKDNRTFYMNYTDPQGNSVVSRLRVSSSDPDSADMNSEQIILRVTQPFANHNGGNLVFGPDGYLYLGFGDGGSAGDPQNNAQRTDTLLGKLLRIDVESGQPTYSVPVDNPFVNNSAYRPEIWATGLRNPWRFSFDRQTKDLWIGDVGQNRAEEIDFQPASRRGGENYGWRRMEGLGCYPPGSTCDRTGIALPILEYGRQFGQSVTGGYVYRGSNYPALRGFYLYGDFGSGNIWAVQPQGSGWDNRLLLASQRQISTFGEDESGELYLADYRGEIYRITAGPPSTSANAVVNAASFAPGISAGSLATVFGAGITAFPGIVQAGVFPLPTELSGTSVTLNGIRAPIIAMASMNGQEQINFQVPYELASASQATLAITANGQSSAPVEVPIVNLQPEIFAVTRDGQTATIWATGLGPVTNQPGSGLAAPMSPPATVIAQPTITIGTAMAAVSFAGLAPNFAGLYQINVALPAGVASGAPVVIAAGPAISKPAVLP
jgi:glucose/arabinose dehydrogenase